MYLKDIRKPLKKKKMITIYGTQKVLPKDLTEKFNENQMDFYCIHFLFSGLPKKLLLVKPPCECVKKS